MKDGRIRADGQMPPIRKTGPGIWMTAEYGGSVTTVLLPEKC